MVVNVDDVAYYFEMCNDAYFENNLPVPDFDVLHSYKYCAYFSCDKKWLWSKTIYNPIIYFSDYYQFSEKQVINLMVHEMIHYYLAINGIDTRGTHGKDFMKMARKLNKKFGLHITEFIDISKLRRNDDAPLLGYWWSKLIY